MGDDDRLVGDLLSLVLAVEDYTLEEEQGDVVALVAAGPAEVREGDEGMKERRCTAGSDSERCWLPCEPEDALEYSSQDLGVDYANQAANC